MAALVVSLSLTGTARPPQVTPHYGGENVDTALPIAHTCSKQIELPKYSSKEVLEKRLKTAITWATDFAGMG